MTFEQWLHSWECWLLIGSMILGIFAVNIYNFWERSGEDD